MIKVKKFLVFMLALLCVQALGKPRPKGYSPSKIDFGFDAQYWSTSFNHYLWTANSLFDHKSHGIYLSFDYLLYNGTSGKVGLGISSGWGVAANVGLTEEIQASLVTLPVGFFASYRAHLFEKQLITPYIKCGYEWLINTQTSKTGGERAGWRRYQSLIAGGGFQVSLNTLDSRQGEKLDAATGINEVYLTIEYFLSKGIFGEQIVNLEHQEFRVGLRIEG